VSNLTEASEVHSWGHDDGFICGAPSRPCWVVRGRAAALGPFIWQLPAVAEGWFLILQRSALTLQAPIWSLMDKADDVLGTGMTLVYLKSGTDRPCLSRRVDKKYLYNIVFAVFSGKFCKMSFYGHDHYK